MRSFVIAQQLLLERQQAQLVCEKRVVALTLLEKRQPLALAFPHLNLNVGLRFRAVTKQPDAPKSGHTCKQLRPGTHRAVRMLERTRLGRVYAVRAKNLNHRSPASLPPPCHPVRLQSLHTIRTSNERVYDDESR